MKNLFIMLIILISFVCSFCFGEMSLEFDEDRIGVCDDIDPTHHVVFVYTSWIEAPWIPTFLARVAIERGLDDPEYGNGLKPGCVWHYAEEVATSSSLLGAVHFETGELGFGASSGVESNSSVLGTEALLLEKDKVVGFEIEAQLLQIVVVRPNKGVWKGMIADGGPGDQDLIRNGWIQVSADELAPLDGYPLAPVNLDQNDIVIALDINQLIAHYAVIGN